MRKSNIEKAGWVLYKELIWIHERYAKWNGASIQRTLKAIEKWTKTISEHRRKGAPRV